MNSSHYARKSQIKYVDHLFKQISFQIGKQFRFSNVSGNYRTRELSPALELLKKANVVTSITHSAGQGVPLGAQAKPKQYKLIMLDIALTQVLLGTTGNDWILSTEKNFINKGMIAEAFVGQELLAYANPRQQQQLYYWQRQERGSQAEIDYLITLDAKVIPVEVKSGKGSTLKSMQLYLDNHLDSPYGIRFSSQIYSVFEKIHSYPLYAVCNVARTVVFD